MCQVERSSSETERQPTRPDLNEKSCIRFDSELGGLPQTWLEFRSIKSFRLVFGLNLGSAGSAGIEQKKMVIFLK
jgi:hypothetical protein